DQCIVTLTDQLAYRKGIEQAHVVLDNGDAELCLHYDPNRITLDAVERLVHETGAAISDRYHHEQIPVGGLEAADAATSLTHQLEHIPGVLHANTNYAAGLVFVAYDTTIVQRPAIEQVIRSAGARALAPATSSARDDHEHEHGHDHGSAPAVLP